MKPPAQRRISQAGWPLFDLSSSTSPAAARRTAATCAAAAPDALNTTSIRTSTPPAAWKRRRWRHCVAFTMRTAVLSETLCTACPARVAVQQCATLLDDSTSSQAEAGASRRDAHPWASSRPLPLHQLAPAGTSNGSKRGRVRGPTLVPATHPPRFGMRPPAGHPCPSLSVLRRGEQP